MTKEVTNPIIMADFPDPDIIRVGDTYYMVSTTMHMMPGCVILRSYDLIHWETATHVYETLDGTPGQKMIDDKGIYANGMWAASFKHHNGKFYIVFVCNDTHKTYLYTSEKIEGPWQKSNMDGFFHDSSLLFDDDGRTYIVYGNREIWVTELKDDLSGPKPGGIHKQILKDSEDALLGYEGAHIYKRNGKYYIFFIHILKTGNVRRTEACFVSDQIDGPYTGKDVMDDAMGYRNAGVAQGGIIDTPEGDWYAYLFQDYGALGRIPVLMPMHWENDFPVLGIDGKIPFNVEVKSTRPDYQYAPLVGDDDFDYQPAEDGKIHLKNIWQWNHEPEDTCWSVSERPGYLRIKTSGTSTNLVKARNMLTQRTLGLHCEGITVLDGEGLKDGDYAGICTLQSIYGFIGLTKENGQNYIVMMGREKPVMPPQQWQRYNDTEPATEYAKVAVDSSKVELKVVCNFGKEADQAEYFYKVEGEWVKLGITLQLHYTLEQFMGCRFGLFCFSTQKAGGHADFDSFQFVR